MWWQVRMYVGGVCTQVRVQVEYMCEDVHM